MARLRSPNREAAPARRPDHRAVNREAATAGTARARPTEETACNLCGASEYDVVATTDREGCPLQTTMCRRCGLVWTNPRPSAEAIDEYYRREYREDYKKSRMPGRRKVLRGMLGALERRRWLGRLLQQGDRVLDAGSGAGELVFLLRAAGFDASGLEPDESFAEFAREVLRVPVETGAVAAAERPERSLDAVTMFHALEHVADPVAVLTRIARWLRPSAVLVVEVPNVEARCQAPGHRFHFAHLFAFSPGTLEGVAARAGFAAITVALTEDGGNIIGTFRRQEAAAEMPDLSRQYQRTRAILDAHTPVRHYLSSTPYRRALSRAGRRLIENRLLARYKTVDDIVQWAARQG
jgi:2-polyprenyl-3-methyl-5-hydroxy-6-metoxy-1,4-benzoquinol methylase